MSLTISNPEDSQGGLPRKKAKNFLDFSTESTNPTLPTEVATIAATPSTPFQARGNYQGAPAAMPVAAPVTAPAAGGGFPSASLTKIGRRPAYNPMSQASAAAAGSPGELIPGMKTYDNRPDGLASSVNAQGNNVYDNASILRLQRRNGEQAGPSVNSQDFGGNQSADAGAYAAASTAGNAPGRAGPAGTALGNVAAAPDPSTDVAAPNVGVARRLSGDVVGAETERKQRLAQLEDALGNIGSLNTRGKKDLFANLMGAKSQLTESRIKTAGDFESQGAKEENDAAALQAQLAEKTGSGNADRTERGMERRDAAQASRDAAAAKADPSSFANQLELGKYKLDAAKLGQETQDRTDAADEKRVSALAATYTDLDPAAAMAKAQRQLAGDKAVAQRPNDSIDSAVGEQLIKEPAAQSTDPNRLASFLHNPNLAPTGVGLSPDGDPSTYTFGDSKGVFGLVGPAGYRSVGYPDGKGGTAYDNIPADQADGLERLAARRKGKR